MASKRNFWIFIGFVVLAAAVVSGFVLMQATAEDILVQSIETTKTISHGRAVVEINVDTLEKDSNGKIEVWASRGEAVSDGHPKAAFRVEVLEASESKALGAVIVSDGETLWAYSPSENKVFVGTPEEAQAMMADNGYFDSQFGEYQERFHEEGMDHDPSGEAHSEHPESAEEAVAKILEYFNASKSGLEIIAGENANQLELEPIPEQMPEEYIAVGGWINLSIGQESNLPLAVSYTGGSLGEFKATVLEFEIFDHLDESLFTFSIPEDAEVVTFSDLEPQSLTLEEAGESTEFALLTLPEDQHGVTLVDILEVRGTIVQRYTFPEGGSFSVAQGVLDEGRDGNHQPSTEGQSVEVRDTTGVIYVSEDGTQVLLTWTDGNLTYTVAGDLDSDTALSIAESLQ